MLVALRVHVLSLLVGTVLSLNHGNFIGDGNEVDRTSDVQSLEDFFENFTPLPPVIVPTLRPTWRPTPSPVISPTRPPVKAGRFTSPVATPTFTPANRPGNNRPLTVAPVPVGRWQPDKVSSYTPPRDPNNIVPHPDSNGHSDEPKIPLVTEGHNPYQDQHNQHTTTEGHDPYPDEQIQHTMTEGHDPYPDQQIQQPQVETRMASYNAEWGSDIGNCNHVFPNVFFNCHEGGVIGIKGLENAKCTQVGNDRVQCTQNDIDSDSSIEFTCSGIRKVHLMSTAIVGPNLATECRSNGNVVKYLTLSRECTDGVNINPSCNGGIPWKQGDVSYCASPATCSGKTNCSELKLEPLAMSNTNTDVTCSRVDPYQDLEFHPFDESYLSSTFLIDWRISGQKRGCLWNSPPLLIRCENGGKLEFDGDYPFCSLRPKDNVGECQSFAPYSQETEEIVELSVRCNGMSESQLNLSAKILSQNVDVECVAEGTILQSIMLSRGCGEPDTDEFTLVNRPSFCDDEDQAFVVDDNTAHCYVGNTCSPNSVCNNMQLPSLTASTGSAPIGQCIYVM